MVSDLQKYRGLYKRNTGACSREIQGPVQEKYRGLYKRNTGPVQEESVSQIIRNLPNKNGFDRISIKLLKRIELEIVKPLTLLINHVLNTGQIPENLN